MTHTPTAEQTAIVDAARTGEDLVIDAGAGAGKTSTLNLAARAQPGRAGMYLAYNKAIAEDAKRAFPPSVRCQTAHSVAFRALGRSFAHRLNGPRMPAWQTARQLGIRAPLYVPLDADSPDGRLLAPQPLARLVMDTITRFCHSDTPEPQPCHVPVVPGLDHPAARQVLEDELVPLAVRAWADLADPAGQLRYTHDCYLKLWQLGQPTLPCDYVLLDEAQDANPVIEAVVVGQAAQKLLVGDRCQSIYAWRGAVDAMSRFTTGRRLVLSRSFRFGPAVADEANKWLNLLHAPLRLTGADWLDSTIGPSASADAILCRTNAEAVRQCVAIMEAGRKVALVGGGDHIRRLAQAAAQLQAGLPTDHPELLAFSSWAEVQAYVDQDESGQDLRTFVRLVDAYTPTGIIQLVDMLVAEQAADLIVSTAHKAKGREWRCVRIAGDFAAPPAGQPVHPSEARLAYVAVTRAQHHLDRGGLDWIDHYQPTLQLQP